MTSPTQCSAFGSDAAVLQDFAGWLQQVGGVPEETARQVAAKAQVHRFGAGASLFSAGEVPQTLFFLRSGLVRFYYLTAEGKAFNKNFLKEGSVATSLGSFLEARPSPFFAETLEDTTCTTLPTALVHDLRARDLVWERLIAGFITRLALQKERREASFLLNSAVERYEAFLAEFADIAGRVPQYHIASYLGITPVALSRIRARRTGHRS